MSYVDSFLLAVKKDRLDDYRDLANWAADLWMSYGALEYVECIADDVPDGVVTSFPMAVKLEADEIVVVAWIRYESREHRDAVNAAVMADETTKDRMGAPDQWPFDGQRMMWGGFSELVRR